MKTAKPTVLAFTGFAQSGKDTAAGFLTARGWTRLSFADALRDSLYALNPIVRSAGPSQGNAEHEYIRVQTIVDSLGWDKAKVLNTEIRELLQRFGTEVGRALYGEDFWVERVTKQIKPGGKYVISDVRFPNEAQAVHDLGGKVWRINRAGTGAVNSHVSDTGIDSLPVDGVIPNMTTMLNFKNLVLDAAGVDLD